MKVALRVQPLGKSVWKSERLKRISKYTLLWPSCFPSSIFPKEWKTLYHNNSWTHSLFIGVQFLIAISWRSPICPPTYEWIKHSVHAQWNPAMSSIMIKESSVEKWMQLETMMLCKINQTCKLIFHMVSLASETQNINKEEHKK